MHPYIWGDGVRPFHAGELPLRLRLISATTYASGMVRLAYQPTAGYPVRGSPADAENRKTGQAFAEEFRLGSCDVGDAVSHSAIETIPTRMTSAKGAGIERFPRRLLRVHHTHLLSGRAGAGTRWRAVNFCGLRPRLPSSFNYRAMGT